MKTPLLIVAVIIVLTGSTTLAQEGPSQAVASGGVFVRGWTGKIDAKEAAAGLKLENARLADENKALHVTTGPAVTYWNPGNKAKGAYTVSATFTEPKYMSLNNHPHPYGIMVGGNDLGTEKESYVYCAAYGNGTFIMRGFGPQPFQLNGRGPTADTTINKAAGVGQPVTQKIEVIVTDESVSCSINGKEVGSYPIASVVGAGKLKSADGIYGLRFAHNTDATVTGFTMSPLMKLKTGD
jgi:hypothetical protein